MKKYLPLILVGGGLLIVLMAVLVVVRTLKSGVSVRPTPEANIPELPQSQWPLVSLAPTVDAKIPNSLGHLLDFKVQKINVPGASTMDYLLVYNTSNGGQQGVPGTIKLVGGDVDKNLLLGSESSGKFRFDAGVSQGTMTLTFRDSNGKSLGKISTDFHLQVDETVLTSVDGKYTFTLDKPAKGVYFTVVNTLSDGYQIFASDGKPHSGK